MLVAIKREERNNLIYTTYEGKYSEFPPYDDELGTRSSILINETTGICRATYFQSKKENFISRIRALAEQNRGKEFSLKYPDLASRIEEAASRGLFQLELSSLDEDELEALENEGFEILRDSYCYRYIVKW